MMRKLLVITLSVLLVAFTLPLLVGIYLRSQVMASLPKVNNLLQTQITLQDYQQHWFTSTARFSVAINPWLSKQLQSQVPGIPADLSFLITSRIEHGPMVFNGHYLPRFVLSRIRSDIQLQRLSVDNTLPRTTLTPLLHSVTKLNWLQRNSVTYVHGNPATPWPNAHGHCKLTNDFGTIDSEVKIPGFTLDLAAAGNKQQRIQTQQDTLLSAHGQQRADGLWQTHVQLSLSPITATTQTTNSRITLSTSPLSAQFDLKQGLWNGNVNVASIALTEPLHQFNLQLQKITLQYHRMHVVDGLWNGNTQANLANISWQLADTHRGAITGFSLTQHDDSKNGRLYTDAIYASKAITLNTYSLNAAELHVTLADLHTQTMRQLSQLIRRNQQQTPADNDAQRMKELANQLMAQGLTATIRASTQMPAGDANFSSKLYFANTTRPTTPPTRTLDITLQMPIPLSHLLAEKYLALWPPDTKTALNAQQTQQIAIGQLNLWLTQGYLTLENGRYALQLHAADEQLRIGKNTLRNPLPW